MAVNSAADTVEMATKLRLGPGSSPEARGRDSPLGPPWAGPARVAHPKVEASVQVAHPLGMSAVPADLEGAGFEVVVARDASAPSRPRSENKPT